MANKRFTFADAKAKIKELEDALEEKAQKLKNQLMILHWMILITYTTNERIQ